MKGWVPAAMAVALLCGCSHPDRLSAVPQTATTRATVPGMEGVRYWVGDDPAPMAEAAMAALQRERALHPGAALLPAKFLAISGGGGDGAFGAGLLVGWTEAGTRPEFKVVTGISTGALTAPFAFLGPSYDDELKAVYTSITATDVFESRPFTAALLDDAMADTRPLHDFVARYADAEMLAAIAREHRKGRFLLVGTTNLDAHRPVIWDMGAIAASGAPGALELFRDILVASAAIPGAFPPVMIDVEADGVPHQEMHVDGGAASQVFIYPATLNIRELSRHRGAARKRVAYIIRNARLDSDWAETERQTVSIAGAAISSLIHGQGIGDLYRIYLLAQRDGIDFNLAYIGPEFHAERSSEFDPAYMRALFDYGYRLARNGYPWRKRPPGLERPAR